MGLRGRKTRRSARSDDREILRCSAMDFFKHLHSHDSRRTHLWSCKSSKNLGGIVLSEFRRSLVVCCAVFDHWNACSEESHGNGISLRFFHRSDPVHPSRNHQSINDQLSTSFHAFSTPRHESFGSAGTGPILRYKHQRTNSFAVFECFRRVADGTVLVARTSESVRLAVGNLIMFRRQVFHRVRSTLWIVAGLLVGRFHPVFNRIFIIRKEFLKSRNRIRV